MANEPSVDATSTDFLPVLGPIAVDMVKGEELKVGFRAAGTFRGATGIVGEDLHADAPISLSNLSPEAVQASARPATDGCLVLGEVSIIEGQVALALEACHRAIWIEETQMAPAAFAVVTTEFSLMVAQGRTTEILFASTVVAATEPHGTVEMVGAIATQDGPLPYRPVDHVGGVSATAFAAAMRRSTIEKPLCPDGSYSTTFTAAGPVVFPTKTADVVKDGPLVVCLVSEVDERLAVGGEWNRFHILDATVHNCSCAIGSATLLQSL